MCGNVYVIFSDWQGFSAVLGDMETQAAAVENLHDITSATGGGVCLTKLVATTHPSSSYCCDIVVIDSMSVGSPVTFHPHIQLVASLYAPPFYIFRTFTTIKQWTFNALIATGGAFLVFLKDTFPQYIMYFFSRARALSLALALSLSVCLCLSQSLVIDLSVSG